MRLAVCAFATHGTLAAVEKVVLPDGTAFRLWNDLTDYRAMLESHWNHPSVVIWDACNES